MTKKEFIDMKSKNLKYELSKFYKSLKSSFHSLKNGITKFNDWLIKNY